MKKLVTLMIFSIAFINAYSQDSMSKKMENKTDNMNKKPESTNDPMNKKIGNVADSVKTRRLPEKPDSVRRKSRPKTAGKKVVTE